MTPISRDAGTVAYGSPYHVGYFRTGIANNVPLIDGEGQAAAEPGVVEAFDAAQNRLFVHHPHYRSDASVQREYRIDADGFQERTVIELSGSSAKRLGVTFQTTCTAAPSAGLSPQAEIPPPANTATGFWQDVKSFNGQATWAVRLDCGAGRRYRLDVTGPPQQRVYLARAPNTPLPATRTTLYYETQGVSADFDLRIRTGQ